MMTAVLIVIASFWFIAGIVFSYLFSSISWKPKNVLISIAQGFLLPLVIISVVIRDGTMAVLDYLDSLRDTSRTKEAEYDK
jgi:hypothetical protein